MGNKAAAWLGAMFSLCLVAAAGAHEATPGQQGEQSIDLAAAAAVQVVDAFSKAIAAGDLEAAKALLDPALIVLESGGVERSREQYMAGHAAADAAFLKDARQSLRYRRASAQGGLAWVLSESRTERVVDGKSARYANTETMLLQQTAGVWRIVHIHWSSHAIRD